MTQRQFDQPKKNMVPKLILSPTPGTAFTIMSKMVERSVEEVGNHIDDGWGLKCLMTEHSLSLDLNEELIQ